MLAKGLESYIHDVKHSFSSTVSNHGFPFDLGDFFSNKKVPFRSDNLAVVHIINKQSSSNLQLNILFEAEHITGKENLIAD